MNNGYQCRWRTYAREDGRMAIIRGEGEGDHAEVYDAFNVVRREGMQGKVVSNERVDIPGIERPGRLTPERQAEIRSGLGHMKKIADFKGQNPYEHARGCHFDGLAEMAYHEVGLHPVLLDESTALELNRRADEVYRRVNEATRYDYALDLVNRVMQGLRSNAAHEGLQQMFSKLKRRPLTPAYF